MWNDTNYKRISFSINSNGIRSRMRRKKWKSMCPNFDMNLLFGEHIRLLGNFFSFTLWNFNFIEAKSKIIAKSSTKWKQLHFYLRHARSVLIETMYTHRFLTSYPNIFSSQSFFLSLLPILKFWSKWSMSSAKKWKKKKRIETV